MLLKIIVVVVPQLVVELLQAVAVMMALAQVHLLLMGMILLDLIRIAGLMELVISFLIGKVAALLLV